jgi:hypothetical protein
MHRSTLERGDQYQSRLYVKIARGIHRLDLHRDRHRSCQCVKTARVADALSSVMQLDTMQAPLRYWADQKASEQSVSGYPDVPRASKTVSAAAEVRWESR